MSPPRVVSLVPSATETLVGWGVTPIACTRFCEQPSLVHVGGTKDPDVAAIIGLRPDLVVVDREENRLEDHDALVDAGLQVHALGVTDVAQLDEQLGALAERVGVRWAPLDLPAPSPVARSAWVPIWRRPWMALGAPTYGTSVLARLGIANVAADLGPYPEQEPSDAAARGAALVIAPDEPYPFGERHRAELDVVAPVRFIDGRDLLWWGERTRTAIARLSEVLA